MDKDLVLEDLAENRAVCVVTARHWLNGRVDGAAIQDSVLALSMRLDESSHELEFEYPPVFKQCEGAWQSKPYSSTSGNSFCKSGCLVCALCSLVAWAGVETDPLRFAAMIDKAGAFVGANLGHPSAVEKAVAGVKWHGRGNRVFASPRYGMKETSLIDWTQRPADIKLLAELLKKQPVVVQVDYDPLDADVDSHFVLAYRYEPDPNGGLNDDLLVMDPMTGLTSVLTYFNPAWLGAWMERNDVSKVSRTLVGARAWEIVPV